MKNIKSIGSAMLILSIIAPGLMMAEDAPAVNTASTSTCANIDTFIQKVDNNLGQKEAAYDAKKVAQAQNASEKRAEKDAARQKSRDAWVANKDSNFKKLEAKATTDTEKTAVTTFESTVMAAGAAEKTAVDAAISAYRTSMTTIATNRKGVVDTALKTLQTAVDTSASKAKSDCLAGVDQKTIKANFSADVKTAKTAFSTTLKDTTQMKADMKTAEQTKKDAMSKARSDYKTAYTAALTALKTAFGK